MVSRFVTTIVSSRGGRGGFNFEVQHASVCRGGVSAPRRYEHPQRAEGVTAWHGRKPHAGLILSRVALQS